jgi:Uncharacterised nucleotidyltransferase
MSVFDPSIGLLVELIRRREGSAFGDKLEQVLKQASIDWNDVFMRALWHKVAFIALQRLIDTELLDVAVRDGGLPLLLLNHWKQLHRVNLRRNEVMLESLRRICDAFDGLGTAYAVGKGGPLLIGRCYAPSERKMYDLDFLAPRDALSDVCRAMSLAGFQMAKLNHSRRTLEPLPEGELRKWLLLARGLPNFLKLDEDPVVDVVIAQVQFIIGSTASGSAIKVDRLLACCRDDEVGWLSAKPVHIRRPADVDILVQLALHIARETLDAEHHEWKMSWNLIKICDLDRFLHDARIKPSLVLDRSSELGFREHCLYALQIVEAVFPSPVTAELISVLSGPHGVAANMPQLQLEPEFIAKSISELSEYRPAEASQWTRIVGVKTS